MWRRQECLRQLLGMSQSRADLFGVMPSVNPVKFSPLLDREGTKDWMVENLDTGSKLLLASIQLSGHRLNLIEDRFLNVRRRHSTRNGAFRSLAAGREIASCQEKERRQALRGSGLRPERGTGFETFAQPLGCISVGEEEMLQNLGDAPSSFGSLPDRFRGRSGQRVFQFFL